MATQCRESKRKPRRNLIRLYGVLVGLAVAGMAIGFAIGKFTAPQKTVTITEKVEVPVYESGALPKNADVFLYDIPLSDSLQRYIYEICAEKSVPVMLALAMIEHESGFNPEVVSSTNDYGLMQINAVNHDWLGLRSNTEPQTSSTLIRTLFAVSRLLAVTSKNMVIMARL